jgi:HNH endonuclease
LSTKGKSATRQWLMDNVEHRGDNCLTWPFSCARGYGHFKYLGKFRYAHRYMCELAHGDAPEGHEAAHSCGRGDQGCVNPRHLSWKTKSDNQRDCRMHGTQAKHRTSRYGKLTAGQVIEIRTSGEKQCDLAKQFGVHETTISNIRTGRTRKRLAKDPRTGFYSVSQANRGDT